MLSLKSLQSIGSLALYPVIGSISAIFSSMSRYINEVIPNQMIALPAGFNIDCHCVKFKVTSQQLILLKYEESVENLPRLNLSLLCFGLGEFVTR